MAPKSHTHFSRRGAAKELLASSLSYAADEAPSPVVRYVRSRIDIPEVGAVTLPVESVLDGIGRSYVLDYEQAMMKTPDEWSRVLDSEPPVTPYMDEVLKRDPVAYHAFIGDLVKANMLGFTYRPKDLVTPFFVAKKSGAQRLVWDARVPNRRFRDPPPLAMGTSAAYGRLQLPDDRKEDGSFSTKLFCAQADVRNYFYALGLREELGLFFSLPPVSQASLSQWGVEAVGTPEGPSGGWVWPFLRVVPMGWSWAFWLGQRANAHVCCSASGLGFPRVLTDHGPVPPLDGGVPCLLPYCDNINVIGTDPVRCNVLMHQICDAWRKHGVQIHEVVEATDVFTSLGRLIDGASRRVFSRPERSERLRQASLWLEQRPRVTGREVERYVGYEASEGPFDVFSDIETVKAPKSTSVDLAKGPWELNPQFTEVPVQALQGPQWKQAVSARVHVEEPITIIEGRASNMTSRHITRAQVSRLPRAVSVKRPAASPKIVQKSFLKGRPFVGATKEERIAHRLRASGPFTMVGEDERSFLEWNAVAPETQACYKGALDDFQTFVDLFELPLHTAAQVDLALMNYADYAWSIGLERAAVLKTYAAYISAHPDFSRKGPSEAVGLREQDLFLPSGSCTDYGFNLHPSARGEYSKTSLSDESLLLDSVEVPWLGPLLARARSGDPQAPLFRLTAAQLGVLWRKSLELAEVPTRCVPYQLRRGGPSHDRLKRYRSMDEIKRRGRWASDYTMKRYEAHALVQQELAALPVDVRRRAEAAPAKLHAELERLLARPQRPFVELMCGSAALAKAVHAAGWASEGWGYADDPRADLLDESLIGSLVLRIPRKEVAGVHVGLDCKTWSRARKNDGRGPSPLRDDANLHGLPLLAAADAEKVRIANRLLANVLRLLAAAVEAGVPFSLENPRSSRLWLVPKLLDMARDAHAEWASVDYCQYQVPWKKATTFLLFNWLPAQPSLRLCTGCQ
ncbi:unnamed protein product [Prorocentrum cordatum]|uniref:Uncharacterized protein n=1 Tax=Prorocentrum cordatum TaxID=2364126 RepID=A0ABN9R7X2_9DINO|nr:unnamed protein product [Polarella glacialis]